MSFYINNTEVKEVYFNGSKVKEIYYNNNLVWKGFSWPGWANATWGDIYDLCKAKQSGEIAAWPDDVVLGATKTTTLSAAVLGPSSFNMRLVGIDTDGDGVLTFHSTTLSSTKVVYTNIQTPTAGALNDIYNYCDAKNYIKSLSKVFPIVNPSTYSTQATTFNCPVWIMSMGELGFSGYPDTAYPYFTDDASRNLGGAYLTRSTANNNTGSRPYYITHYGSSDRCAATESFAYLAPAFAIG